MERLEEVWKKFRDTKYEVSNHGRVRRPHVKTPPKYLKLNVDKDGYFRIDINLEWCTTKENATHARVNGLLADRKGEKASGSKLKPNDVLYIRHHGLSKKWEYVKKFGISVQTVYDVWERKSWTHI